MFRSETRKELNAFAGDASGSRLPANHGPWVASGTIDANKAPPHNFPRAAIEKAIATTGFQLWRMKSDASAAPPPAAPAKRPAASAKRPARPAKRPAAAATKRPSANAGRPAAKRPAADVKRHAAALAKRRAARA